MARHITKRSRNSWTVVVDLGADHRGKRRQLWRTCKGTKKDAERLLTQLLHQRDNGIDLLPGKISTGDYLEIWLRDYAKEAVAPKTYRGYQDTVRRHLTPTIGAIPLSRLRPQHIQAYLTRATDSGRLDGKGGLSPQSVLHLYRVLHTALGQAIRWQLLSVNPADGVEPPHPQLPELRVLLLEEVGRLLAAADKTRYGPMIRFALLTGMRKGEVCGVRWRDIDLDEAVVRVQQTCQWLSGQGFEFRPPKTPRSRRTIALSPASVVLLRQVRSAQLPERLKVGAAYGDYDLAFATMLGKPIDPSNFRQAWLKIVEEADLVGLRFHGLRHACATFMLQQGTNVKVVSERLGHSGVGITLSVYAHVLPGIQAEAAARLDSVIEDVG